MLVPRTCSTGREGRDKLCAMINISHVQKIKSLKGMNGRVLNKGMVVDDGRQ